MLGAPRGTRRKNTFQLFENEGLSKSEELDKAIASHVQPGMTVYVGSGANACLRALLRRFWGTKPGLTLVIPALSLGATHVLHAGLARKLITSYYGAGCIPSTRPSTIVQRLCREGKLELESWSLLSLTQRLMAGAMGLPFFPTRSLVGSTMAEHNARSFSLTDDPFTSGLKVGVVKALKPDIALVHGLAADRYGFAVTAPSLDTGDCPWGVKASSGCAVLTVEKVVPTSVIRANARLVDIPGHMVAAVCEAPMGAHPEGLLNPCLDGVSTYQHDMAFLGECLGASSDANTLDMWLDEWVKDCPHTSYLRKLGQERIESLCSSRARENHVNRRDRAGHGAYSPTEVMLAGAAREVMSLADDKAFSTIIMGMGPPALASWAAYYELRRRGKNVDLMTGTGFLGFSPRPGDTLLLSTPNMATSRMMTDIVDCQGVFVAGNADRCMAVLNAAQIDRFGNLNSSMTSHGDYLVGSGGANDASNASSVIVLMPQSRGRFVERLPYTTSPGTNVKAVVSDMGVFEKRGSGGELMLVRYFSSSGGHINEASIQRIKDSCGWDLKTAHDVRPVPPPNMRELTLLRQLDPDGVLRYA